MKKKDTQIVEGCDPRAFDLAADIAQDEGWEIIWGSFGIIQIKGERPRHYVLAIKSTEK